MKGKKVEIKPAKGRPMLTWVGKRLLSHVTAFPAQHVETFSTSPSPMLGESGGEGIWKDWPSSYPKGGLLFHGDSVTIFENRAPWRPEFTEWTSMPIAQLRYDEKAGKWTLYCADRNDRWHKYEGLLPTKDIDQILAEIDRDPTGIFCG